MSAVRSHVKNTIFITLFILFISLMPSRTYAMALPVKYTSKTAKLTIRKKRYYGTTCYIAHLKLKRGGYRRFKGGISKKKKGETTLKFAKRMKAVFAVSGDYAYPNGYTCVRKGVVYQGSSADVPAVYNANTGMLMPSGNIMKNGRTLRQMASSGDVYNTFNFGPAFLSNGKVIPKRDMYQKKGHGRPRAFIGTNGRPGDMYFVVTEGADTAGGCRSDGRSRGLTSYQCAMVLKKLGCGFGVPLDGGGSSQMIYKGRAVNNIGRIAFTQKGRPMTRKLFDFYYLSRKP